MNIKKFIGTKDFYKSVLILVLPVIIQNGISNFVNLLDNVMVGSLGTEPFSGVAIVNQLIFVYQLMLFGGISGAGIFTAQYFGRGDDEGVRHTFRFKVYTAIVLTILGISVLWFFREELISAFLTEDGSGCDIELAMGYGKEYIKLALWALVPTALTQVYASTLRETKQTVVPMVASIVAVFVNGIFNYILIFGINGLIKPLGVSGAAIGTIIARTVELMIVAIWTHTHVEKAPYIKGAYRSPYIPRALVGQIFIKGAPLFINELLWSLGVTVLNQCYSTRGLSAVAAVNIASTIANIFNIFYISMGTAVSILVGGLLGAGKIEEAKDTDRKLITFSCVSCLGIGLLMAVLSPVFTLFYDVGADVKELAILMIIISSVMMPFNSYSHNCYFTLRSGGQTMITFLFDCVFEWVVCVPVAYTLSRFTEIPIIPLYMICTFVGIAKCVIGFFMLKSGKWAKKLV